MRSQGGPWLAGILQFARNLLNAGHRKWRYLHLVLGKFSKARDFQSADPRFEPRCAHHSLHRLNWKRPRTGHNMRLRNLSHVSHALFLLAISCSALAQPDPRGSACIGRYVQRLDDGILDTRAVAAAVMSGCRPERVQSVQRTMPHAAIVVIQRSLDALHDSDVDSATVVVLEWRRARRSGR